MLPQRDYQMNASFETFVRWVATYFEPPDELRSAIQKADPQALSDIDGIWEEAVNHWEIHQD